MFSEIQPLFIHRKLEHEVSYCLSDTELSFSIPHSPTLCTWVSPIFSSEKKKQKMGAQKKKHLEAPICLVWRAGRTTASGLWDPAAASPCNTVLPTSTAARVPVHQSPAAHAHLMKTPTQTCPAVSHGCRGVEGGP